MLKEVADTDLANFDSWRPAVDENIPLVSPNSNPDQGVEKGFVPNAIHPELPVERIHSRIPVPSRMREKYQPGRTADLDPVRHTIQNQLRV